MVHWLCWTGLGVRSAPLTCAWPSHYIANLQSCLWNSAWHSKMCEKAAVYMIVMDMRDWPMLNLQVFRVQQLESLSLQCPRHLCCKQTSHHAQYCSPLWHCSYKRIASDPNINHFFEGGVTLSDIRSLQAVCAPLMACQEALQCSAIRQACGNLSIPTPLQVLICGSWRESRQVMQTACKAFLRNILPAQASILAGLANRSMLNLPAACQSGIDPASLS